MKAIFAVMNTTSAVVKIRSEKPPSLPPSFPPFLPPSLPSPPPSLPPSLPPFLPLSLWMTRIFINLLGTKHQNNAKDMFEDFDLIAGVVLIIMKLTMDIRRLLRVFKPRLLRLRLTMHRWI